MQGKTKLLAGVAAALLIAVGLSAMASAHMNGGRGMGGGMGGGMMGEDMMERYDADKDGKITQAEIDQNRSQWFSDFDADKNAGLTLQEFTSLWLKARNQMIVREFQFFDRDGNGLMSLDEYRKPLADLVATRDHNGDGVLSQDDRRMRLRHREGDGDGRGKMQGGAPGPDDQPPGNATP